MVNAILEHLSDDQIADFLAVVSDELKTTQDSTAVRITLEILPARLWPRIHEVARLRIENKLMNSIAEGLLDPYTGKTVRGKGALGTWAKDFLQYFIAKGKVGAILRKKLRSQDSSEGAYVLTFFTSVLPHVFDTTYGRDSCVEAISDAMRSGDTLLKETFTAHFWQLPDDWSDAFRESLKDLKESDPDFYKTIDPPTMEADDIPF
jgi:hypothetical protein